MPAGSRARPSTCRRRSRPPRSRSPASSSSRALGGVVAAAAHELGTPLATIKLAATELVDELADRPHLQEDALLVRNQAERCSHILRAMGPHGRDDTLVRFAPFSSVVEEAAEPHADRGIRIITRIEGAPVEEGPDGAARARPPAGDHPGPAQPDPERRRLRRVDGLDRPRLDRRRAQGRDRRRRPGLSARPHRPHRRPVPRAGRRPARAPGGAARLRGDGPRPLHRQDAARAHRRPPRLRQRPAAARARCRPNTPAPPAPSSP